MNSAEPSDSDEEIACRRSYGRAEITVRTRLATTQGKVSGQILDLSLGGARLESDRAIAPGASVWLALQKLDVFATVQWARGKVIGVQFEEKLPKALVLSMRAESLDPEVLEAIEAERQARHWVTGTPVNCPGTLRPADILGARNRSRAALTRPAGVRIRPFIQGLCRVAKANQRGERRTWLLMPGAAVLGALLGIVSALVF